MVARWHLISWISILTWDMAPLQALFTEPITPVRIQQSDDTRWAHSGQIWECVTLLGFQLSPSSIRHRVKTWRLDARVQWRACTCYTDDFLVLDVVAACHTCLLLSIWLSSQTSKFGKPMGIASGTSADVTEVYVWRAEVSEMSLGADKMFSSSNDTGELVSMVIREVSHSLHLIIFTYKSRLVREML